MSINDNTPVLVGCGQVTQKVSDPREAKNPIELMKEASLCAFEDTTIDHLEDNPRVTIYGGNKYNTRIIEFRPWCIVKVLIDI